EHAERVFEDSGADTVPVEDSSTSRKSPQSQNTPSTAGADPAATSMAGASALYKDTHVSGSQSSGSKTRKDQKKFPKYAHQQPVAQVAKSQSIKPYLDSMNADEFKKSGRYINPYKHLDDPQPQRVKAMYAEQIMSTPVITLSAEDTAQQAKELFTNGRFRHVPVVSDNNHLVGILSDRDFIGQVDGATKISKIMTSSIITARPHTTVRSIADLFFKERIGAMPIVSDEGELVGIITRSDILYALVKGGPLELWI
ncbi:MAG: CBS domain-containing protein, partial [Bdellovibrionales bacterium]|nr:CBS domain-containing protein [Bdellovibrionales bacterium]